MKRIHYMPQDIGKRSTKATKTLGMYLVDVFLPFRGWLLGYRQQFIYPDVIAGLTVAGILVPQAMAYAFLAGLPPQMGLYGAIIGAFIGVMWGSSSHVATGPVAIVSLLSLTTLVSLAKPGTPEFIMLAITLALAVGLVQLALGLFRFGFIIRLIPHSVLVGFSTAAALIIAATQVPSLLGYSIEQQEHVFKTFIELIKHAPEAHLLTAAIGVVAFVIIGTIKQYYSAFPISLVVLVIGVAASYGFDLASHGVAVVGAIPSHIPTPSLEGITLGTVFSLLGGAFIIALIGFMETYAVAKVVARTTKQKLSTNQELVGQGLANIGSGLFGGYAIAGSFSRTAVNFSAGARTGMAGIIVAVMTILSLVYLTPYLFYLPKAILAAIVIGAVLQIIDFSRFRDAFKISTTDGTVGIVTFATAFLFNPDDAVLIGVILALALFFQRTMWAKVSEEGFDRDWGDILRRAGTKDAIETVPGMLILRIDMSIFYANVEQIVAQMKSHYERRKREHPVRLFAMDFSGVNYIDLTALETLGDFFDDVRRDGASIHSIYIKEGQRATLKRASKFVGKIHFTHNVAELRECFDNCSKAPIQT